MGANHISDTHSNDTPPGSSQSQGGNEQACKACKTTDDGLKLG